MTMTFFDAKFTRHSYRIGVTLFPIGLYSHSLHGVNYRCRLVDGFVVVAAAQSYTDCELLVAA